MWGWRGDSYRQFVSFVSAVLRRLVFDHILGANTRVQPMRRGCGAGSAQRLPGNVGSQGSSSFGMPISVSRQATSPHLLQLNWSVSHRTARSMPDDTPELSSHLLACRFRCRRLARAIKFLFKGVKKVKKQLLAAQQGPIRRSLIREEVWTPHGWRLALGRTSTSTPNGKRQRVRDSYLASAGRHLLRRNARNWLHAAYHWPILGSFTLDVVTVATTLAWVDLPCWRAPCARVAGFRN